MKLNPQTIRQLQPETIQSYLKEELEYLYNSYSYLGLTVIQFDLLSLTVIKKYQKTYDGIEQYSKYIIRKMKAAMTKYLENLTDKKEVLTIINKYLNQKLSINDNIITSQDNLRKLLKIIRISSLTIDQELLQFLKNNPNFINIITKTMQTSDLDDNNILKYLIEKAKKEDPKNDLNNTETLSLTSAKYKKLIENTPLLTDEEQKELIKEYRNGDQQAKDKMIKGNLRLVMKEINKFYKGKVLFDDLMQEGTIALMRAIESFDVNLGFKFSTYAVPAIDHRITAYLDTNMPDIAMTVNQETSHDIVIYKKTVENFRDELKRNPTLEEIANIMHISKERARVLNATTRELNINEEVSCENNNKEIEQLISSQDMSIEDVIAEKDLQQKIRDLINTRITDERARDVIIQAVGISGLAPQTLTKIAQKYGITRERARQIFNNSMRSIIFSQEIEKLALTAANPEKALKRIRELRIAYRENKREAHISIREITDNKDRKINTRKKI